MIIQVVDIFRKMENDYLYINSYEFARLAFDCPRTLSSKIWKGYIHNFDLRYRDIRSVIQQNQPLPATEFQIGFNLTIHLYRRNYDFSNHTLLFGFANMRGLENWNLDCPHYMVKIRLESEDNVNCHPIHRSHSFQMGTYDQSHYQLQQRQNLLFSYDKLIPYCQYYDIRQDLPFNVSLISPYGVLTLLQDPEVEASLEHVAAARIASSISKFEKIDSLEVSQNLKNLIKLKWIRSEVICINYT